MRDYVAEIRTRPHLDIFRYVDERYFRPCPTASRTYERSCSSKIKSAASTRHIGGAIDRDSDIVRHAALCIIDTVTHEADDMMTGRFSAIKS